MKKCNVCIIGAGSAGIAAAYALRNTGHKVIIIDDNQMLGGTAVNGWVQTWIEGINPPYLANLLRRMGFSDNEIQESILPPRFKKNSKSGCLSIPFRKLGNFYEQDMRDSENITLLLGYNIVEVCSKTKASNGKWSVNEITVCQIETGKELCICADYFIDSTGDGVLCRLVCPNEGKDYFIGEDPYSRFKETLMPIDKKNGVEIYDPTHLNEPSLFYEVQPNAKDDKEILDKVDTVMLENGNIIKPDYLSTDGYANRLFLNPMTGLGITGYDVVRATNKQTIYKEACKRHLEHWKYVKLSLMNTFDPCRHKESDFMRGYSFDQRNWNYTGQYAPMLGVRESYRINCDYMLRQVDLTIKISSVDLKRYIACGSHSVDFHTWKSIKREDVSRFNNENLVPSGIPYDCLLPIGLNNVLIACRAFGASHIALAARRVNKDMAQLGWAAGFAVKQCLDNTHVNLRNINVGYLQEESGFSENVKLLESLYI